jgi:hypothetical protein
MVYTHDQFDDAFKRLPRDLQWEILVDFVGGYVVRNNRLKRLLCVDNNNIKGLQKRPVEPVVLGNKDMTTLIRALNRGREINFRRDGRLWEEGGERPEPRFPVSAAEFSTQEMFVVLFKSRYTETLSYGYTNKTGL